MKFNQPQNHRKLEMMPNKRRDETLRPPAKEQSFATLGLIEPIVRALQAEGYVKPTEVQQRAIPVALGGADLVACAQTGTGKTAAFVLPLLQRLGRSQGLCRALIVTPTRELALQIGDRVRAYGRHGGIGHTVIYGGVSQRKQEAALRRGPDVLVATPGRLLDLMRQGLVSLEHVEVLVLDEADTMLDMGFVRDIRTIASKTPKTRQTLLFSATMPPSIEKLLREVTRSPRRLDVSPQGTPAVTVRQSVIMVGRNEKRELLRKLLDSDAGDRILVLTRTKHGANRVAAQLSRTGIGAAAIHGDRSQAARERALGDFRAGRKPVLVATDVAARGIDVHNVSLVVNFDLPHVPESYVHRIGRTGRAGAKGRAISFCAPEERTLLSGVERLLRRRLDVDGEAGPVAPERAAATEAPTPAPPRGQQRGKTGRREGMPFERNRPRRRRNAARPTT